MIYDCSRLPKHGGHVSDGPRTNLYQPELRYVFASLANNPIFYCLSGDGLYNDLQHDLQQVEQIHNQLQTANTHKTNVAQLEKYQDLFLKNFKHMQSFSKYFVFGNTSTTMKMNFVWYDSFDKRKITSQDANLAALSSLYNLAVCLCRRGCYMDLAGDGIKHASSFFRQAAWLFNHLQSMVTQLSPDGHSCDFNKETLI